ncbi:MAG TPA: phosphatidylcholine/phosphatidylserine synthase [Phycisphaerales bacterium]|nr:phosphatidylcholine/phosphatidylserine synthase [Phycisphaerales bacterium]
MEDRNPLVRRLSAVRAMRKRRRLASGPHRRNRTIAVVPTLFTMGNLISGFAAIHYAAKPLEFTGPWGWSSLTLAGLLVFLGMFLDSVDGSVARLMRTSSEVGAQLDSLADVVTFGVAPAFMMLQLVSHYVGPAGERVGSVIIGPEADTVYAKLLWAVAATYVCCTGLRLARFNVDTTSNSDHLWFSGLPSPGAAGCVASLIIMHQHWLAAKDVSVGEVSQTFARMVAFGIPFITLLCALTMVSNIPYVHFTNRYVQGRKSYSYVARAVVILALAVWIPQIVFALAFTVYALSGPIRMIRLRLSGRPLVTSSTSHEATVLVQDQNDNQNLDHV